MLGTLILCGSERENKKERKMERKGTLFLEGRNENCAGPMSASAHLLACKGCNGRRRWTKKLRKKKEGELLRGKRESAASRNSLMAERMARRNNWIHSASLIYFCRMSPCAQEFTILTDALCFFIYYFLFF